MKQVFLAPHFWKAPYRCHMSLYMELEVLTYLPLKQQIRLQSSIHLSRSSVTLLCMKRRADDTSPAPAESMKCLNTDLLYSVKLKRYFSVLLISDSPTVVQEVEGRVPWTLLTRYTEPQNHPSVFRDCSKCMKPTCFLNHVFMVGLYQHAVKISQTVVLVKWGISLKVQKRHCTPFLNAFSTRLLQIPTKKQATYLKIILLISDDKHDLRASRRNGLET